MFKEYSPIFNSNPSISLFIHILKPKAHIARFTSTSEYDDYVDTPKNITTIKTFVRGIYEQKNYRKVIQVSAFKYKLCRKCIKTLQKKWYFCCYITQI